MALLSVFQTDPAVYAAAPNSKGRSEKEMAVYTLPDPLDIKYERMARESTACVQSYMTAERPLQVPICKRTVAQQPCQSTVLHADHTRCKAVFSLKYPVCYTPPDFLLPVRSIYGNF